METGQLTRPDEPGLARTALDSLFAPGSVAIVGASDDGRKWGNWLARGALRGEARRAVYLINHRASEVLGRPAHASLSELGEAPELAVIAVPPDAVPAAVDEALDAGARAVVVITATGDPGQPNGSDASLAARVRSSGAVLLGPNCLGVFDHSEQLELVPNPLPGGSIGLISQSGNLALELAVLARREGLGFSRFVSLGNQVDLDGTRLVAELAGHPQTRLIALYLEDFRDGRAFADAAAQAVTAGKPVVALAIDRIGATERAVRSHTGALASDRAAIDAACRAAGIERVQTPGELIDIAHARLRARPARGRRIAVLADGGGHGSVAAAVAAGAGLELPELSAPTKAAIASLLPPTAGITNPIDLAGAGEQDVHNFARVASILLTSGEVDAMLVTGYLGGYAEYAEDFANEELAAIASLGTEVSESRRPLVAQTMYAHTAAAHALREAGIPVYGSIEQAVGALSRLATPTGESVYLVPALPPPAPPVDVALIGDDGYEATRALLVDAGVPFAAQRTVRDAAQAVAAAREIGYPVVLKALGLLHKSDAGGVILRLCNDAELESAYAQLERRLAPVACSVERMAPLGDGVELLIGARWDPRFGPVALAGSGGVYAEILRDTAVALAPVSASEADAMLRSLRAAPLLTGARGRAPLAIEQAARALAALSRLAAAHPDLSEIEINPLLVTPDAAIALDARCVPAG